MVLSCKQALITAVRLVSPALARLQGEALVLAHTVLPSYTDRAQDRAHCLEHHSSFQGMSHLFLQWFVCSADLVHHEAEESIRHKSCTQAATKAMSEWTSCGASLLFLNAFMGPENRRGKLTDWAALTARGSNFWQQQPLAPLIPSNDFTITSGRWK